MKLTDKAEQKEGSRGAALFSARRSGEETVDRTGGGCYDEEKEKGNMEFVLRRWKEEDAASIQSYANHEKIAANLRNVFPYPYPPGAAAQYIRSCIEQEGDGQVTRAIAVDGTAVGSIGVFFGSDVYEKSAELGYWLGEPFWNQGIMSEAVVKMCRYVFSKYNIERIFAEPFAGKRRFPAGCLKKQGFR